MTEIKNVFGAIITEIFSVMLIWWMGPRIVTLASIFDSVWIKALLWLSYTLLICNLTLIIPGAIILGTNVDYLNILKAFFASFAGMVLTLMTLILVPPIFTAISLMIDIPLIMSIGWLVLMVIIVYLLFWLPISIGLKSD